MPQALPFIAAAGMFISAGGSIASGIAQRKQANAQAGLEEQAGQSQARDIRQRALYSEGALRAKYASSGVDPDMGSPLDVSLKNATEYELDAQRSLYNARAKGALLRYSGKQAERAGYFQGAASMLAGASYFGTGMSGNTATSAPGSSGYNFGEPTLQVNPRYWSR